MANKILIIDDDEQLRNVCRDFLAEGGYEVDCAEELEEARQSYQQAKAALDLVRAGSRTEDITAAQAELGQAFQFDPVFTAKILAQMAFEKYKAGEKQKAFEFLDEAIQGNTSSAEAYYCRGILYLFEKKKKQALADFETVKGLQPTPEKNPSIQSLDQFIEQAQD